MMRFVCCKANACQITCSTVIFEAALKGHLNVVSLLVAFGVDLNACEKVIEREVYFSSHKVCCANVGWMDGSVLGCI